MANDVNDTGNQFVWIPVEDASRYKKNANYNVNYATTVGTTVFSSTELESRLPNGISNETDSVVKAQGFYIARFETGNGLVSKKGVTVWTNLSQANAISNSKNFINNNYVKSGIVTGTQWDVCMDFVDGKDAGIGGKFYVKTASSFRHTGSMAPSGKNEYDRVCNIYDLEGNASEISPERCDWGVTGGTRQGWEDLLRGGRYTISSPRPGYAALRIPAQSANPPDRGFRMALYVMK